MRAYALQSGHIRKEDQEVLQKIDYIFDQIPERTFPNHDGIQRVTNCHHICHALAQIFTGYKAVDGRFGQRGQEHSRLEETPGRDYRGSERNFEGFTIIDPLPIGGLRPQLHYACHIGPYPDIYRPLQDEARKEISNRYLLTPAFRAQVEITKKDILEALKTMKEQKK